MEDATSSSPERGRYLGALILGFVAVPSLALATGLFLSDPSDDPATTTTAAAPSTTETTVPTTTEPTADFEADLAQACGPAGLELVALEADGTITPLQQGALNALREVCAAEGVPLPGAPAPPVEEVVVVERVAPPPPTTVTSAPGDDGGFGGDDGYEDGEEEDEGEEGGGDD